MIITFVALSVYFLNLPFGYWRKSEKRFSLNWFLAIHIPVVISIILRYLFKIDFKWEYILLFIFMFFAGQYTGKLIFTKKNKAKSKDID